MLGGGPGVVGEGIVASFCEVTVRQHLMLLAPGHSPVWNGVPMQLNLLVSAHEPVHVPGGGGGGGGGGPCLVALAPG